jgi:hypothetical protein
MRLRQNMWKPGVISAGRSSVARVKSIVDGWESVRIVSGVPHLRQLPRHPKSLDGNST